jgi:predicted AAA+ superfamily ATPase
MKIKRTLFDALSNELSSGNAIVILYGARQTGKTTLSRDVLSQFSDNTLYINADEIKYHEALSSRDLHTLKLLTEGYDIVFIDEAQRIPDIGINLKIIYDQIPGIRLLVTGSSALDLAGKIREPLTGRTSSYRLYPISLAELRGEMNVFELQSRLEEFMLYGMYPGLLTLDSAERKEKYLMELASSYLYRDVLELSYIKHPSKIIQLLKLLAMQVGSEVSLNELGRSLGLSHDTVVSYIDLLEQSFILFSLGGFSRNLRKEVSKRNKYYFWDTGIRNSLLNNFSPLNIRTDAGSLWENFIIAERLKFLSNKQQNISPYFWRTYTGAEIVYIEERQGEIYAFEIKLNKEARKASQTWVENYGNNYACITRQNFHTFVI